MRSVWLAIGVLITSVASAQTPSNKQGQVPTAILLNSRHVYVEAWDGDFFNPHLLPEDRKAILDVQNALQDWNRYLVTVKRRDAEILVVVRKGRIVTPGIPLFKQFKESIEAAAKVATSKAPTSRTTTSEGPTP
jgi:hypothetical protein